MGVGGAGGPHRCFKFWDSHWGLVSTLHIAYLCACRFDYKEARNTDDIARFEMLGDSIMDYNAVLHIFRKRANSFRVVDVAKHKLPDRSDKAYTPKAFVCAECYAI